MRAIFETGFYYLYLIFIIGLGIYLLIKKKSIYFAIACIILGLGDAFHLIPRAIGLYTKTLDNPSATLALYLGVGKLVTSITMTVFYALLYLFIYKRINKTRNIYVDLVVASLIIARITLLCYPQNQWTTNGSDLYWGIYRNIPFVLLGALVVFLLFKYYKKEKYLSTMWIAVILSFIFYLLVVLLAGTYSWVGMMMLPKTICYMYIGVLGYLAAKKNKKQI